MAKSPEKAAQKPNWPAENNESWPVDKIRPNPRNSTKHSDAEVREMAAAIDRYGWTVRPLIDDTGMLIAGESRWRAAKLKNLAEIPVTVARGWSEEMKRAYVIWDNASTKRSAWDDSIRDAELADLKAGGFDMALTGFPDFDTGVDRNEIEVREIETTKVADEFWISLRGPLEHQAAALQAMREALKPFKGVSVELGTIAIET